MADEKLQYWCGGWCLTPTRFTYNGHHWLGGLPKELDFWDSIQFIKQATTIKIEHTQNYDSVSSLMTLINLVELDIHVQRSCSDTTTFGGNSDTWFRRF